MHVVQLVCNVAVINCYRIINSKLSVRQQERTTENLLNWFYTLSLSGFCHCLYSCFVTMSYRYSCTRVLELVTIKLYSTKSAYFQFTVAE